MGARVRAHALSLSYGYCAYLSDKLHQAECQVQSTGSLPGFLAAVKQRYASAHRLPTVQERAEDSAGLCG